MVIETVSREDLSAFKGVVDIAIDEITVDEQRSRTALGPRAVLYWIVDTDVEMRIA
jgi:hypothetical protein